MKRTQRKRMDWQEQRELVLRIYSEVGTNGDGSAHWHEQEASGRCFVGKMALKSCGRPVPGDRANWIHTVR